MLECLFANKNVENNYWSTLVWMKGQRDRIKPHLLNLLLTPFKKTLKRSQTLGKKRRKEKSDTAKKGSFGQDQTFRRTIFFSELQYLEDFLSTLSDFSQLKRRSSSRVNKGLFFWQTSISLFLYFLRFFFLFLF